VNIQTESVHTGEFLLSEGNGEISREGIVVAAGEALPAGQVLGMETATGHYKAYTPGATDGTEVAAAVLYAPLPAHTEARRAVGIVRMAEVSAARMTGLNEAATADFKTRHIIVR